MHKIRVSIFAANIRKLSADNVMTKPGLPTQQKCFFFIFQLSKSRFISTNSYFNELKIHAFKKRIHFGHFHHKSYIVTIIYRNYAVLVILYAYFHIMNIQKDDNLTKILRISSHFV